MEINPSLPFPHSLTLSPAHSTTVQQPTHHVDDLGQRHFQGHVQSLVCVCHRSQGTCVVGKEVSEQLVCQPALSSEALWGTSKKGCPSETLVQGPLFTTCTLHKTEALSAAPLSHSCLTVPVLCLSTCGSSSSLACLQG